MKSDYLRNVLLGFKVFQQNIYLENYIDLIVKNLDTKKEAFNTQRHHVIPKHLVSYLNLEGEDTKFMVNLSYENHILAHYYLALCATDLYIQGANIKAIKRIIVNSKSYCSASNVHEMLKNFYERLPEYKFLYQQSVLSISKENSGRIAVNRDKQTRYVKASQLDQYLENGWLIGRYLSNASREQLSEKHKGLKMSAATKMKMSASHTGKPSGMLGKKHSPKTLSLLSKKHSGENNGMYGKHHTDETKILLSEKKKHRVDPSIITLIVDSYKAGKSLNKLRCELRMSVKKIQRILYECDLISYSEYCDKYQI